MIETILIGTIFVVWALGMYVLLRNSYVCSTRIEFINDESLFPDVYKKLPSYDEMLLHPKHWRRWNKRHWLEYVRSL